MKMKGVVLCGGLGTRLLPLTKLINKHLLPVFSKPMAFYPIQTLVQSGIEDIVIVVGGNNVGDFVPLLGNGEDFGLKRLHYIYQKEPGGIAQALALAEDFVGDDNVMVILGDNITNGNFRTEVDVFSQGCKIFLKEVPNPEKFGCPIFETISYYDEKRKTLIYSQCGQILEIIEKPKIPPSKYAVIGIYIYDAHVFYYIRQLKPSARGELEITDVNNAYLKEGKLNYNFLGMNEFWIDAGSSHENLLQASILAKENNL
ncbi:MAG: sugar phosphate nucleotidyltransferase [Nanoarchaeota archaeon]